MVNYIILHLCMDLIGILLEKAFVKRKNEKAIKLLLAFKRIKPYIIIVRCIIGMPLVLWWIRSECKPISWAWDSLLREGDLNHGIGGVGVELVVQGNPLKLNSQTIVLSTIHLKGITLSSFVGLKHDFKLTSKCIADISFSLVFL